jgi:hypothetical protein
VPDAFKNEATTLEPVDIKAEPIMELSEPLIIEQLPAMPAAMPAATPAATIAGGDACCDARHRRDRLQPILVPKPADGTFVRCYHVGIRYSNTWLANSKPSSLINN